ncbi:hypothetical protein EDD86DRAFT_206333 [Gorgonomyces haynaldii]|nr:hypothetical protein EDD86DRAFT_206333 [Gorgonomyces haynaldii]
MDAYGMAHGPLAYELIDDALVVQGQTIPLPPVRGLPVKYQDLDQLPVMVSLKELKQLFNDLLRFKTFERQPMEQVKPLETVKQLPEREPVRELANVQPGRYNPLEIGRRDMEPFTGPSFGSPMGPVGGYPGGGSIVGPDHPMFNNPYPGYPPNLGPPRFNDMQVPPGARFDPVSPFGNPQRPSRMGRGMPFTGEPNPDHFAPPGGYDPYI